MKHTDASLHHVSGPGWQISGELELTANPDFDRTVGKWLTAILNPLHLRTKRQARYRFGPVAVDACFLAVQEFQAHRSLMKIPNCESNPALYWSLVLVDRLI